MGRRIACFVIAGWLVAPMASSWAGCIDLYPWCRDPNRINTGACTTFKQCQAAETAKAKSTTNNKPVVINNFPRERSR